MVYTGVVLLYMSFWNQWIGRVIWTLDMVLMTCILLLLVMDMLKTLIPKFIFLKRRKKPPDKPDLSVAMAKAMELQNIVYRKSIERIEINLGATDLGDNDLLQVEALSTQERERLLQILGDRVMYDDKFEIIFDTGATMSVTGFKEDFVDHKVEPLDGINVLRGIAKDVPIVGRGTVSWNVIDDDGNVRELLVQAYFAPQCPVRLFSPQAYLRDNLHTVGRGRFYVEGDHAGFLSPDRQWTKRISFDPAVHLPIVQGCNLKQVSSMGTILNGCVLAEENQNLTERQKLLLKWHCKLGHLGFKTISWILRAFDLDKSKAK